MSRNEMLTEERVREVLEDRRRNSRPEHYLGVVHEEPNFIEKLGSLSLAKIAEKELIKVRIYFDLLKDYSNGTYDQVTEGAIIATGLAVSYLIWPIDVIPDFAGPFGFLDDVLVILVTWSMVRDEIFQYLDWRILRDPEYATYKNALLS